MNRIQALDGLRGLAILLVILYHGYYIWENFYPYGAMYKNNMVFKNGNLGVQLFFMISGFVILMSLEKTATFWKFLKNRWIRLFPAMVMVSLLIYGTASVLPERPLGQPSLNSLLPGILFINPSILSQITGLHFPTLETSFWTIYLEVKFYLVFGGLYYLFGEKRAIIGIFIVFILSLLISWANFKLNFPVARFLMSFIDTFIQFGWFTAGTLAYLYFKSSQKRYLQLFFIVAFISIFSLVKDLRLDSVLMLIFLIAIFISILISPIFERIFSYRFFTFIGFISYSLYLVHENMMVALISKIHTYFPFIPSLLLPVLATVPPIILAYLITVYLETPVQKKLKNWFNPRKITAH